MQHDSHHTWIIVKGMLDATAVMSIKVEKENLGLRSTQYMGNRHRNVVIDAPARSMMELKQM